MKYDVFISHIKNPENIKIVKQLKEQLEAQGISVWFDEDKIKIGDNLEQKIFSAIEYSYVGIVLITPEIISGLHEWFIKELRLIIEDAKNERLIILPIFHNCAINDIANNANNIKSEMDIIKNNRFVETSKETIEKIADDISVYVKNRKKISVHYLTSTSLLALGAICFSASHWIYQLLKLNHPVFTFISAFISIIGAAWFFGMGHMGKVPQAEWGQLSVRIYHERLVLYTIASVISVGALIYIWALSSRLQVYIIMHLATMIVCAALGHSESIWYRHQPDGALRKRLFEIFALPLLYSGIWFSFARTILIIFLCIYVSQSS